MILILTLFLTMISASCLNIEAPIVDANQELTGTITYSNINVSIGTDVNETPTIENLIEGATLSYSIKPQSLPENVNFNTTTGSISGTPRTLFSETSYTVTATDDEFTGSITTEFTIAVSKIAITGTLSYTTITVININTPLSIEPSNTIPVGAAIYTIEPTTLPEGVDFNSATGIISGTPTTAFQDTYRVTATGNGNYSGTIVTNTITIDIVELRIPGLLSYSTTSATVNTPLSIMITNTLPSRAVEYSIEPTTLPEGVDFNSATGIISGTPRTLLSATTYTVTASGISTYTGSSIMTSFILEVLKNDIGTAILSYTSSSVELNTPLSITRTSTIPSEATVVYSIDPQTLPENVTFNSDTGMFSGVPTATFLQEMYTVTATGNGIYTGTIVTEEFTIEVLWPAISGNLSYNSTSVELNTPLSITKTSTIPSEATVVYSINPPTLPENVTFNSDTGMFSGVPTAIFPQEMYTVTATGIGMYSGTIVTAPFTIEVLGLAISGNLSYNSTSVELNTPLSITKTSTIPSEATVVYSIDPPTLPNGVVFSSSSGEFSGNPTAPFTQRIYTVTAAGNGIYTGTIVSASFTIEVKTPISGTLNYPKYSSILTNAPTPLTISPQINNSNVDLASVQFSAADGFSLPTGMSINNDGEISWDPNLEGTYTIKIEMAGTMSYSGSIVSNEFTVLVADVAITIGGSFVYPETTLSLNQYVEISPNEINITPENATVEYRFLLGTTTGFSINKDTGVISGSRSTVSSFTIVIRARGIGAYTGDTNNVLAKITVEDQ